MNRRTTTGKFLMVVSCVVLSLPFAVLAVVAFLLGVAGLHIGKTVIGLGCLATSVFCAYEVFDVVRWHIREARR